jgi:gliding motility-associated-like protein
MSKKCALSALFACLLSTGFIFAQQQQFQHPSGPVPGACNYDPNNPNANAHTLPPSPQNGNGTLGQTFNMLKCGLNYVQASNKLGQRFYASCCPSTNGLVQPAAYVITGIPNCAVIEKAYLWAGTSGNGQAVTATVKNPLNVTQNFPMTIIGSGPDKCWGAQGTYTYRADVTPIISGNGTYLISGLPTSGYPISGSDCDGATLFIIYSNPNATYRGHIVIHDGCVTINGGTTTQTITGINACATSSFAQSFCINADLQQIGMNFNMNGGPAFSNVPAENWWNFTSQNTTVNNAQATSNFTMSNSGDCYNFLMMGIYYQTTNCVTCTPSAGLTITSTTVPATCSLCNGTATVTVTGGTAPYTYSWNTTPVQTTATATGLCAGTYTVTVSDASGCFTSTATITITTTSSALTVNTSLQTNVSCFGQCNGSATVTVTGGTSPYTYSWNTVPVQTTSTATGLCAGSYTVTVTDAAGCTGTRVVTITQPTQVTATTSQVNVTCNGSCNGSASVVASGGTPGYTYNWAPSGGTNANATGLCAGTYTCTITDANGCTITKTFTITQPTAITLTTTFTQATCNQANGTATVTITGGTPNYTINWAPSGGTNATATGLTSGSYTVTVTDANGCTRTATVVIPNAAGPAATLSSSTNVTCFNACNGTASVTVTGGQNPITYAWAPSGGNSANATGLCAGNYTCTVTDANGCTSSVSVTITQPTQLTLAVAGFDATCNGSCNGQGVCIPSGGTPNYTFNWTPSGGNNPSATGLCAGVYTCTVTDQNGCTASDTAIVNQPAAIVLNTTSTTSHCNMPDGTASVTIAGGVGPYSYAWNPSNQTTANATGLTPNTYTVTVTDFNGCTATATVVVPSTPSVTASITGSTNATCFGNCDGTANVTASGGNAPYTYAWAPSGGNTANATGLCAGTYTCTVTDQFGCSDTAVVTITQPTQVTVTTTKVNVSCFGGCNGTATATAAGGSSPYTYSWSNSQLVSTATGLCAGNYTIYVTDANGCTATATVTITQPTAVVAGANASPAMICIGSPSTLSGTANGGTPGYTYNWMPGNLNGSSVTVTPTVTTTYTVTTTDLNGCTDTASVTVTVNPLPVVTFTSNPSPASGCAPLCVDFQNTTPNSMNCAWNFQVGTSNTCNPTFCFTSAGTYDVSLTVTDNNGCVNSVTMPAYVTVYPVPVADFTMSPQPTTVLNGTIQFTDLSSGSPNQWTWSFGDVNNSSSTIQNPQFTYTDSGTYIVELIVVTQYGCRDTIDKSLRIEPDFTIYVPNAFTPNGDNNNEVFMPQGDGIKEDKFKLWIFDRWGNMIFYTEKWGKGWDGRANSGKDIAQEDVYVWKIEIYDYLDKKHQYIGHVSLIK